MKIVNLSLLLLMAWLTGCATINYDAQADQQLTAISQTLNEQLYSWEAAGQDKTKKIDYRPNFYDKASADVMVLKVRMTASQDINTARLNNILDDLSSQIEEMRQLHIRQGTLSPAYIHGKRDAFNAQLRALITYELSLKVGAGKTEASRK